MTQLFSNGVDTTLAATLTIGGTSATLADGSGLSEPNGGDFELVTLIAAGNFEIVRMTARAANVITITRAQEGTTAREWPTGTRVVTSVTAGSISLLRTPDPVQIGVGANASGANSMAVGPLAVATGEQSVAVGVDAQASGDIDFIGATALGRWGYAVGDYSVAVGYDAWAQKLSSTAVGGFAYSTERWGVAVGLQAKSEADYATVCGAWSVASGVGAVVLGPYSTASGEAATILGPYGTAAGPFSVGLGGTIIPVSAERVFQVEALPAVPRSASGSQANAAYRMTGCQSVIMSQPLNLLNTQTHTIPVPSGSTFFPEEVGVIVTAADTVSGQPTIRFGITGAETQYLAATATAGLAAAHDRHVYGALSSTVGAKTLRAEITVAGAGTTLTGRIYWKGFAVVDS